MSVEIRHSHRILLRVSQGKTFCAMAHITIDTLSCEFHHRKHVAVYITGYTIYCGLHSGTHTLDCGLHHGAHSLYCGFHHRTQFVYCGFHHGIHSTSEAYHEIHNTNPGSLTHFPSYF